MTTTMSNFNAFAPRFGCTQHQAEPAFTGNTAGERVGIRQRLANRLAKRLEVTPEQINYHPPTDTVSILQKNELNTLQRFGVKAIGVYQRDPIKNVLWAKSQPCKYANAGFDHCSDFVLKSIVSKGFWKGCFVGLTRMFTCSPIYSLFKKSEPLMKRFAFGPMIRL